MTPTAAPGPGTDRPGTQERRVVGCDEGLGGGDQRRVGTDALGVQRERGEEAHDADGDQGGLDDVRRDPSEREALVRAPEDRPAGSACSAQPSR